MSTYIYIPERLYIHLACFLFLICLFYFESLFPCSGSLLFLMALAKAFGVVVFIRKRGLEVFMIIVSSLSLHSFKKD
jgi:hypothetical protein